MEKITELNAIIGDSSGLVALAVDTDSLHETALAEARRLESNQSVIVVPADVFSETMNILGKMSGHSVAGKVADNILSPSSPFILVDTPEDVREQALKMFKVQPASVSYTDCVVMAFANHYDTKSIFGSDRAFRRAGYKTYAHLAEV